MNIKTWDIKVLLHEEDKFDSATHEKHEVIIMEETLRHLVQDCEFIPRQNDIIGDMTGLSTPFVIDEIVFDVSTHTIEFLLSVAEDGEEEEEE